METINGAQDVERKNGNNRRSQKEEEGITVFTSLSFWKVITDRIVQGQRDISADQLSVESVGLH